jgi:hypothetical protein
MSRGLGRVQRLILETLPRTKQEVAYYRGGESCEYNPLPFCLPGWVRYRLAIFLLPDDVYDLRAVAAMITGRVPIYDRHVPQKVLYRAMRGLVKRGTLVAGEMVRVAQVDKDPHGLIHYLADGKFLFQGTRQTRFVTLAKGTP